MVLDKLASLGEGRRLKRLQELAQLTTSFEPDVDDLTDAQLRARTEVFRQRLADG